MFFSLLTPGLGYLQNGDKKSFYKTITFFYSAIILAVTLRLFISFWSLILVIVTLTSIYAFAAIDATLKAKAVSSKIKSKGLGKAN